MDTTATTIPPPTPGTPWLDIARREIGVHEVPGVGCNPRIADYHSMTRMHATSDEIAWLDDLARRRKWELLQNLQRLNSRRSWDGPGMAVDARRVSAHLAGLLRGDGENPRQA